MEGPDKLGAIQWPQFFITLWLKEVPHIQHVYPLGKSKTNQMLHLNSGDNPQSQTSQVSYMNPNLNSKLTTI